MVTSTEPASTPGVLRSRVAVVVAAAVVLAVYISVSSTWSDGVFWSPDSGSKFIQLLTLDSSVDDPLPYLGRRIDSEYSFFPHELPPTHPHHGVSTLYPRRSPDGEIRFHWPNTFSGMSLPFYRLLGVEGLGWIPMLSGALVALLSGWMAHRFTPGTGPWVAAIVGLAGPVCFYSVVFWEHMPATLFMLVGLWQALRGLQGNRIAIPLAALSIATAAALRLEALIFAVAILAAAGVHVYLAAREGRLTRIARRFAFGTVTLLAGLTLGAFALVRAGRFGDKERGFAADVLDGVTDPALWLTFPARFRDLWIHSRPDGGPPVSEWIAWLGVTGIALCVVSIAVRRRTGAMLFLAGCLLVGSPSAAALLEPTRFRSVHALLQPAPYLVLGLLFARFAREGRNPAARFVGITTLFYSGLGTLAMTPGIHGGLEWGMRYLLTAYPLATICAVVGGVHLWRQRPRRSFRVALALIAAWLLLIGAGFQKRGLGEIRRTKDGLAAYDNTLRDTQGAIVTDVYWLPLAVTRRYVEREFFTLAERDDLGEWLQLAEGKVDRFVFVGSTPLDDLPPGFAALGEREIHGMTFGMFEIVDEGGDHVLVSTTEADGHMLAVLSVPAER